MSFLPIASSHGQPHWSFRRIRTTWLMLLLAGCMTTPPRQSTTAWRFGELPAPLGAQVDQPDAVSQQHAKRPLTLPPTAQDNQRASQTPSQSPSQTARQDPPRKRKSPDVPKADSPTVADADIDEPSRTISPSPQLRGPALNGRKNKQLPLAEETPQIAPSDVTVPPGLEFTVSGPSRKQVGGSATFHLVLTNSGDRPLEKLTVRCAFDEALVFSGSDKREVRQRVDRLAVGESKDLALSLAATSAGTHCCRFAVVQGEGETEVELASKQVCVDFVTRHVEIEITGPAQRTEGSRAEYNITLSNKSLKAISDARAVIAFDKALIPREASAGAEQKPGSLTWRLDSLGPLERIQLQVEFECRSQAHRACVAVEVAGGKRPGQKSSGQPRSDEYRDQDEACLEILPVPGTLDLQIGDREDPVEVGQSGTFEVTVENIGLQPARRVVIEAIASENLKIRSAKVVSGDRNLPLKFTIEGSRLVFDQIDQLEPAVRLVYVIEVVALKSGPAELRASMSSSLSSTAVTTTEPMSIVDP